MGSQQVRRRDIQRRFGRRNPEHLLSWVVSLVAAVERSEADGPVRVAVAVAGGTMVDMLAVGAEAVVNQVDVAEVAVVVVFAVGVTPVVRVARSRGARLLVRVTVGADDERVMVFVVETVVAAFTCPQTQRRTAIYHVLIPRSHSLSLSLSLRLEWYNVS